MRFYLECAAITWLLLFAGMSIANSAERPSSADELFVNSGAESVFELPMWGETYHYLLDVEYGDYLLFPTRNHCEFYYFGQLERGIEAGLDIADFPFTRCMTEWST